MKRRPASRLLLLDEQGFVLLFRFVFTKGALAGEDYWGTPGGAVEEGETFVDAARRELFEETGMKIEEMGESVAQRKFTMKTVTGGEVMAEEHYFVLRVTRQAFSRDNWNAQEKEVMVEHRWWSVAELQTTSDVFYPENLVEMLGGKT